MSRRSFLIALAATTVSTTACRAGLLAEEASPKDMDGTDTSDLSPDVSESGGRHQDKEMSAWLKKNNGGFASVGTIPDDFALEEYAGLSVRVKGDGRRYMLRLRTDRYLDGPAYESGFDTVTETWITVRVPFRDFAPTFRGRRLRNLPAIDGADVQQIGFMLGDKQAGPFRLEIDWIKSYP